jgi:hypothetical protein
MSISTSPNRNILGLTFSRPETPAPRTATPLPACAQTQVIPGPHPPTVSPTIPNSATPGHLRTPIPHPRQSTRALVQLAREQVRSSTPLQALGYASGPLPGSPLFCSTSLRIPLHRSLGQPDLPSGPTNDAETSDMSRPSTPVSYNDTDIDPTNFPPPTPTATNQSRASRFLTIRLLPDRPVPTRAHRIPTHLNLRSNTLSYYRVARRARRIRRSAPDAAPLRVGMRAGALSADQKVIMHLMEHHMLWSLFVDNPWPEDRSKLLQNAREYAERISGISGPEVVTEKFEDTVRLSTSFRAYFYTHYRPLIRFLTSVGIHCPKSSTWSSKLTGSQHLTSPT